MARRDRLVERILARPPEMSFADVRTLLEEHGWTLARTRGSHNHFTRPGEPTLTIPAIRGRHVKRTYLEVIVERLQLED